MRKLFFPLMVVALVAIIAALICCPRPLTHAQGIWYSSPKPNTCRGIAPGGAYGWTNCPISWQVEIVNQGRIKDVASGSDVLQGKCSPDRLLAAIEAAREFVPEDATNPNSIPAARHKAELHLAAIQELDAIKASGVINSGTVSQAGKIIERTDAAIAAAETRQRNAIETFNKIFKECVKSDPK